LEAGQGGDDDYLANIANAVTHQRCLMPKLGEQSAAQCFLKLPKHKPRRDRKNEVFATEGSDNRTKNATQNQ
jgi:hypothetical protein